MLTVAAPAHADRMTVADEAGDTAAPGPDITSVSVRNLDRGVSVTLTFARDRPGEIFVGLQSRHHRPSIIFSSHRRTGPDDTDFFTRPDHPCHRLTSDWDRRAATMQLRLPARCLHDGNYGALRIVAVTEGHRGGEDVDFAPQDRNGDPAWSDWVPRG
uniref:Uncharacterized protein n=1 Tax=uncultured Nocardioidaceae bacterium TaxID=253824 RepID=A0A6J4MLF8_9ACTN|nr:MAG: hypothetical protein AVDCRST_MAG46-3104 [uncultured Nocardioidaceae bacterium]